MRRTAAVLALLTLTLAGCGGEPPAAPAAASSPTSVAAAPSASTSPQYDTPTADLPPAPPVETWVVKGNDFQQTLDLNMQTAMIENLMMSPDVADEDAARALAYYVCTELREYSNQPGSGWVQVAYPETSSIDAIGVALAAQAYCLDTVEI